MKKWFPLLILLFIMYFSFQFFIKMYSTGYKINYQIKTENKNFEIKEQYSANRKGDFDNYYIEINYEDELYNIQINKDYQKKQKIIQNIYHVKTNNYSCIFPVFLDKTILTDVICLKNGIQYNYHTIYKEDRTIDSFVDTMKNKGYDSTIYVDKKNDAIKKELYAVYPNNHIKNQSLLFNTYKGYEIITDSVKSVSLFNKDIYEQKLKAMFNKYYIIADYNQTYEFNKFYIVDLKTGYQKTVSAPSSISFDSYIQGIINNEVYLYDRDNKIQYKINPKKEKVEIIGSESLNYKTYKDGKFEEIPLKDIVNNDIYFVDTTDESFGQYKFISKTNKKYSGYNYYYKIVNNNYEIYRSNIQNKEKLTYITTISELNNIKILKDYFYFIENNEIYYYHDLTGVRTLVTYQELEFNKNNLSYIPYQK